MTVAKPPAGAASDRLGITDAEFERVRTFIRAETGIDLREVKRPLLCARLARRLRYHGDASFSEYWHRLRERDPDGAERVAMVNAITTNKTDFLREPHHFEFLRTRLVPAVAARRAVGDAGRLRLWSAGCSTGEEPYSIALTILDALPRGACWDVRILASDINSEVLAAAAAGEYAVDRVAHLERGLRQRHFQPVPGDPSRVRVSAAAAELVTFRSINLCRPPWPIHTTFDAIFCRNVIIYFDRATQRALVARFVDLLAPGGYLVLGHSESLLGHRAGLEYAGQTIYRKAAA